MSDSESEVEEKAEEQAESDVPSKKRIGRLVIDESELEDEDIDAIQEAIESVTRFDTSRETCLRIDVIEHTGEEESRYPRSVSEEIQEQTWVCDTHGELSMDELAVATSGMLICEYCSVNAEAQPNADIDPSIEMEF